MGEPAKILTFPKSQPEPLREVPPSKSESKPALHAPLLFRAIAFFVDIILVSTISTLFSHFMLNMYKNSQDFFGFVPFATRTIADIELYKWINVNFILVVYFVLSLYFMRGQTFGKRLMNLRVVTLEQTPLSFQHAAIRGVGWLLSYWLACLGFSLAFFRNDRRTLHDLIAKTKVTHDFS